MLKALLKQSISEEEFFSSLYQKEPKVFASNNEKCKGKTESHSHAKESTKNHKKENDQIAINKNSTNDIGSNKRLKTEEPEEDHHELFAKILSLNVNGLTNILELSRRTFDITNDTPTNIEKIPTPLFFQDQNVLSPDEMIDLYNNNPLAAYVDGCSIILNHLELLQKDTIGKLCKELENNSFPNCFANGYLTPPSSQAVSAHADDRDVFVLQVYGEKNWKVYGDVPIPFPYHHEQVGKNGLPIPECVLEKQPMIETKLVPGDVLYIPRGYVHEACTTTNQTPSFHVTIALPTHDWTYSNIFTIASRQLLDQDVSLRKAIPLHNSKEIEDHVQQMITILQQNITSESLINILYQQSKVHKEKSKQITEYLSSQMLCFNNNAKIGYEAIHLIRFTSAIRAATQEERDSIMQKEKDQEKPRGITAREEILSLLFAMVQHVKSNPNDTFVISELRSLPCCCGDNDDSLDDLSILCFVKCCVEFGAIALVSSS